MVWLVFVDYRKKSTKNWVKLKLSHVQIKLILHVTIFNILGDSFFRFGAWMTPYRWALFLLFGVQKNKWHWILSCFLNPSSEKLIDLLKHITLWRSWLLDKEILPEYCPLPLLLKSARYYWAWGVIEEAKGKLPNIFHSFTKNKINESSCFKMLFTVRSCLPNVAYLIVKGLHSIVNGMVVSSCELVITNFMHQVFFAVLENTLSITPTY